VLEPLLLNLADMIMLTDTTGLLTGEEKISVQGVQVAVQRETQRQRQTEFLRETQNPTDLGIMGIAGRGKVLRAISQDIGLAGEEIVPSDEDLEKKQAAQEAAQAAGQGPIQQMVQKGVQQGVQQGVQKITSELTAGILAAKSGMSEIGGGGTEPVVPGGPPTQGLPPNQAATASHMPGPPGAPGNKPPVGGSVGSGMGVQSATVTGNTPGPNAPHPISGGPG
jgi:hypothetical protein